MRLIRFFLQPPRPLRTPLTGVRRRYLYLGQEYGVRVALGTRSSLKITDEWFVVTLAEMTREQYEAYIEGWYRRRARAAFRGALDRWMPVFEERGYCIPCEPRLKLFYMKRAWGRCYYSKDLITINLHLIKLPQECFDYIVLHELCHFIYQDHSPRFKALMSELYPEWRQTDAQMKAFVRSRSTLLQRLHM